MDDQACVGFAFFDVMGDLIELDQDVLEIAAAITFGFAFAQGEWSERKAVVSRPGMAMVLPLRSASRMGRVVTTMGPYSSPMEDPRT